MSVDGERRTEILETAADLFASSGLRTSLKEIADACGILPGSLYHHFDSKEALIVELIERYRADLDTVAEQALHGPRHTSEPIAERIVALGRAIAACAVRHRAALLLTLYEPPSGASDELVRAAARTPLAVEKAMVETLRRGRKEGYIRPGIDLESFAHRLVDAMLHISLGVLSNGGGAEDVATIRCHIELDGVAVDPPDDAALDRSAAFRVAQEIVDTWDKPDDGEDERFAMLCAVARTEFGRRGYEATTVRDIASAAGLSTGSVYRLVGSKDELLSLIMRSFAVKVRDAWSTVLGSPSSTVEKLDALMWINIGVVDRFNDEYNISRMWLRESPPSTLNLGSTFSARMRDLKALVAKGVKSGELRFEGPSSDIRAYSLFELIWMPQDIVRNGSPAALELGRGTVLRGAARRG